MNIIETDIPDIKIIEPKVFGDERGFFMETWSEKHFANAGINEHFVQDNHSLSAKGILRGLHYQIQQTQGKLVRVTAGAVFDVAVDIRRSSPTFGQYIALELSADNKKMLWIPEGFAHGFLSLRDGSEFMYKCTDTYAPEYERCIIWNDDQLNINWPINGMDVTVSDKDSQGVSLANAELFE